MSSSAGAEKLVAARKIGGSSPIYLIFKKQGKRKGRKKAVGFNITCRARESIPPATITAKMK